MKRVAKILAVVLVVGYLGWAYLAGPATSSPAPAPEPVSDCWAAEQVFDMYQADVAAGVVSAIDKVRKQATRLRLLGCPGWQY